MFNKNQKIQVITDPYGGMLGPDLIGQVGTVTSAGDKIVGLRFDNGLKVACWLVEDANGTQTIKVKPDHYSGTEMPPWP